jgi:predicted AAA+ superfamily ATPase
METIELWPFSQGEIEGTDDGFIDVAFDEDWTAVLDLAGVGLESRDGYIERALRGGFPEAIDRKGVRRARFFESYVDDLIDRDVTQLADIERRGDLKRLVATLAASMSQPVKVERFASDLGLSRLTVERYVSLLEEVFLVKRLDGWSSSVTARAQRMRKLIFVDSGLAADQLDLTTARLRRTDALVEPLIENFVISELARQLTWSEARAQLFHYRTDDHVEVDAVIEGRDGRIVGIEVKSAESVRRDDFVGLRHLQSRLGDRFHLGIVVYAGKTVASFGDRLVAVPIDAIWR